MVAGFFLWGGIPTREDFNQDEKVDLFISMDDPGDGASGVPVLYENRMVGFGGVPAFVNVSFDRLQPQPDPLSHGVTMGDFDQDGNEDFFLTSENSSYLYKFNSGNGKFEDVLSTSFPSSSDSLLSNTYSATWVDFDHDGDLDLHLGRMHFTVGPSGGASPLRDAFYKNQGPDSTYRFVEISEAIGLVDSTVIGATRTAVWCDVDNDHLWEVFSGDCSSANSQSRMFAQQPNGHFEPVSAPFSNINLNGVEAAKWVDTDNSGSFELVLKESGGRVVILNNFQNGFSGYQVLEKTKSGNNLGVLDYDLDSWIDLFLPGSAGNSPVLWVNFQGNDEFAESFMDFSAKAGLPFPEVPVGGLVIADFTGDGDQDLFIGDSSAPPAGGRYYQNKAAGGTVDAPINHWLGIRLENCVDDPATNFGAVVTVSRQMGGTIFGMQQLDGGSGRGSQADRTLIFGLGSFGDNPGDAFSVDIDWPNGESMNQQFFASDVDSTITITRNTEFSIDTATVMLKTSFDINQPGVVDYAFSWITDGITKRVFDEVQITPVSGSGCTFGSLTLVEGSPGVQIFEPEYKINPSTGEPYYEHLIVWEDVPCTPGCSFNYSVSSSTGCRTDSYAKPRAFTVFVCPSSN